MLLIAYRYSPFISSKDGLFPPKMHLKDLSHRIWIALKWALVDKPTSLCELTDHPFIFVQDLDVVLAWWAPGPKLFLCVFTYSASKEDWLYKESLITV